jgi:hypothetical protein
MGPPPPSTIVCKARDISPPWSSNTHTLLSCYRLGDDLESLDGGAIPWTKVCCGCDASVATLTFYEKSLGIKARLWFLKNFWGPLCAWCGRMARVRYGHLTLPAVYQFIQKPNAKAEFKNYSICYVSIRAEGRVQITVEMIENRLSVLQHCLALVDRPDTLHHYMLLDEFIARNPDANPRHLTLVQMDVNRELRLGVRSLHPSPVADEGLGIQTTLEIDQRLRCSHVGDLALLKVLGAKALEARFLPNEHEPGAGSSSLVARAGSADGKAMSGGGRGGRGRRGSARFAVGRLSSLGFDGQVLLERIAFASRYWYFSHSSRHRSMVVAFLDWLRPPPKYPQVVWPKILSSLFVGGEPSIHFDPHQLVQWGLPFLWHFSAAPLPAPPRAPLLRSRSATACVPFIRQFVSVAVICFLGLHCIGSPQIL